jgi:hypothetical protein
VAPGLPLVPVLLVAAAEGRVEGVSYALTWADLDTLGEELWEAVEEGLRPLEGLAPEINEDEARGVLETLAVPVEEGETLGDREGEDDTLCDTLGMRLGVPSLVGEPEWEVLTVEEGVWAAAEGVTDTLPTALPVGATGVLEALPAVALGVKLHVLLREVGGDGEALPLRPTDALAKFVVVAPLAIRLGVGLCEEEREGEEEVVWQEDGEGVGSTAVAVTLGVPPRSLPSEAVTEGE